MVSRKTSGLSIADLKSPEGSKGSPVTVPLLDDEEEEEDDDDDEEETEAVDNNSHDRLASERCLTDYRLINV